MAVTMNPQPIRVFNRYEVSPDYIGDAGTAKTFEVKNVDDKGRIIHYGSLEVNESEIVFRYEHHQSVSRWPFTCIRRYGVGLEGDVFAFEAGRRAPDGEGMYAFKTVSTQACEIRQRIDYFTHYRP